MNILMLSDYIENYNCPSSFDIKYKTSRSISIKNHYVTLVYPSNKSARLEKKATDLKRFSIISTPGVFPNKYRTGGFSLLDAIFKSMIILKGDYDIIHTNCGHRPAQLIPAIVGKFIKKCIIIDEWWEWYGKGGHSELRKGTLGKLIGIYDMLLELPSKSLYDRVISITHVLKNRLNNPNNITVFTWRLRDKESN